mmetsp:Transcript_29846/g.95478  ORF Transcript_29846/g.95478 Transcript_29846/m.95478 type:complete len:119 (+) Transcript_29846:332-688(+)
MPSPSPAEQRSDVWSELALGSHRPRRLVVCGGSRALRQASRGQGAAAAREAEGLRLRQAEVDEGRMRQSHVTLKFPPGGDSWVQVTQNGITYSLDICRVMFRRDCFLLAAPLQLLTSR